MTKVRVENGVRIVTIKREPDAKCELCREEAELRPYGPKGENVCFKCAMKDEDMARKRFNQIVLGKDLDS